MHTWQAIARSILELFAATGANLGVFDRHFDYDAMLREASRRSGQPPEFASVLTATALRMLLRSLEDDADLSALGALLAKRKLISTIATRLRLEPSLANDDDTGALHDAVFIAGLPRTGTTLLHRLMAEHDELATLRLGEVLEPFGMDSALGDRRAREVVDAIRLLAPDALKAHPMDPELPAECQHLMEATFVAAFFVHFDVSAYWQWMAQLGTDELTEACRHYRHLAARALSQQGTFLSKAPAHVLYGAALPRTFPGGRIIRTHRDPAEAVASLASLLSAYRRMFSRNVDERSLGALALDIFRLGTMWMIEMDGDLGRGDGIDIDYAAFVARPVEVTLSTFERIGLDVSGDIESRVAARLQQELVHGKVAQSWTLQRFGLSESMVRDALGNYRDWLDGKAMLQPA